MKRWIVYFTDLAGSVCWSRPFENLDEAEELYRQLIEEEAALNDPPPQIVEEM